jgi:hypothetical protein
MKEIHDNVKRTEKTEKKTQQEKELLMGWKYALLQRL